jgi:uncharacterized protein YciI
LLYLAVEDAPVMSDEELEAIQTGHLAHLARLGEAGLALTTGPFDHQSDPRFRGLVFFSVAPDEALRLSADDPAIRRDDSARKS